MAENEKEKVLLNEEWDLDASASDNESYEIEMSLEETIKEKNKGSKEKEI